MNDTTTAAEAVGQVAAEIHCSPPPNGGKGAASPAIPVDVRRSIPASAGGWVITAADANWLPEGAARSLTRATVTATFQLPADAGGAALRQRAETEFEARMVRAAQEAEQLPELADFRRASERLAIAMIAVVIAGAVAKDAQAALDSYAAGESDAGDFQTLTEALDAAKAKLTSLESQLPAMRAAFGQRERNWLAASDGLANRHRVRAFQDADAARVDAAALPLEEMLAAMMTVEHGRGMASGIRGDMVRRRIKPESLPAPLPVMPQGKPNLIPMPMGDSVLVA